MSISDIVQKLFDKARDEASSLLEKNIIYCVGLVILAYAKDFEEELGSDDVRELNKHADGY